MRLNLSRRQVAEVLLEARLEREALRLKLAALDSVIRFYEAHEPAEDTAPRRRWEIIRGVLQESNRPLRPREVAAAIRARGGFPPGLSRRSAYSSTIMSMKARPDVFYQPGPALWGLLAWREAEAPR
jgi:hypothetical protein